MVIIKYKDGSEFGVGVDNFPHRKSKTLYSFRSDNKKGARSYPLAYFRDEASAKEFEDFLNLVVDNKGNP